MWQLTLVLVFFAMNDIDHKIEGVVINKQGRREKKRLYIPLVVESIVCLLQNSLNIRDINNQFHIKASSIEAYESFLV
jgi:hypothetical protein